MSKSKSGETGPFREMAFVETKPPAESLVEYLRSFPTGEGFAAVYQEVLTACEHVASIGGDSVVVQTRVRDCVLADAIVRAFRRSGCYAKHDISTPFAFAISWRLPWWKRLFRWRR